MKVINVHTRLIQQPIENVSILLRTLASKNDKIWPSENWPTMRLDKGLTVGSKGGHGIIRYTITDYTQGEYIVFKFSAPENFIGSHSLRLKVINTDITEVRHEIRMQTIGKATFLWIFIIRWLHNALIEDAFDKIERHFGELQQPIEYSIWVKILRYFFKRKNVKTSRIKSFN